MELKKLVGILIKYTRLLLKNVIIIIHFNFMNHLGIATIYCYYFWCTSEYWRIADYVSRWFCWKSMQFIFINYIVINSFFSFIIISSINNINIISLAKFILLMKEINTQKLSLFYLKIVTAHKYPFLFFFIIILLFHK